MKRYLVLCGLVFTAWVRLDAGDQSKKDEGFQGGGLKLEEKGLSHNLAFLLRYADAVILTKKLKYKTARYELSVSEVVWAKQSVKIGGRIKLIHYDKYYRDNGRHIETFAPALTSNDFTYGSPSCYVQVPSLLFIRKVSTSDAVSQNWELNGQVVYKSVNGEQGSVGMPHLVTKEHNN